MQRLSRLLYWMNEREAVRIKKEAGALKPWSDDPIFRTTYFCNVRREDDKVTRWIRETYSPYVDDPMFEFNTIFARFINWPETLEKVGYINVYVPQVVNDQLKLLALLGKVWGNAYVVTTHGLKMDKIDYLTSHVLTSAESWIHNLRRHKRCEDMAGSLMMGVEGVSTFMAGQVVADLKNTKGYYLADAPDWWTFALPGPGSRRGMDWLMGHKVPESDWHINLKQLQEVLEDEGWNLCRQDIQNCLCEFSKYMKVSTGGRSKRLYPGG